MAAKKTGQDKSFSNSPFKDLKGLSVSDSAKTKKASERVKKQTQSAEPENVDSFAQEMDWLGVKPLDGREPDPGDEVPTETAPVETDEEDAALFATAIGEMQTTFKDDWPDEEAPTAKPRRMKQIERGQLTPGAQLDLHGLTREEALAKVGFFLEDCHYQGQRTLLLITGKGTHSADGPVLRQAVERYLSERRELVVEWGVAPRRYGGSGALVVFLKK